MSAEVEQTYQVIETKDQALEILMRPYNPEDRGELIALYKRLCATDKGRAAIRSYFGGIITEPFFKASIDNPDVKYRTLLFSPDGQIIGWGFYGVNPKEPQRATIGRLIEPEYQGKGIGTALIGHLIEKCQLLTPTATSIESLTLPYNNASIGSLTKAAKTFRGFRDEETNSSRIHFIFPLK